MFILSVEPFALLSKQVVGPPAAGAHRERPSKPTSFRKSYERRELPVALLHDTKGQQIAWKVRVLPFADHTFHPPFSDAKEHTIGLRLSTKRRPLMGILFLTTPSIPVVTFTSIGFQFSNRNHRLIEVNLHIFFQTDYLFLIWVNTNEAIESDSGHRGCCLKVKSEHFNGNLAATSPEI